MCSPEATESTFLRSCAKLSIFPPASSPRSSGGDRLHLLGPARCNSGPNRCRRRTSARFRRPRLREAAAPVHILLQLRPSRVRRPGTILVAVLFFSVGWRAPAPCRARASSPGTAIRLDRGARRAAEQAIDRRLKVAAANVLQRVIHRADRHQKCRGARGGCCDTAGPTASPAPGHPCQAGSSAAARRSRRYSSIGPYKPSDRRRF